MSKAKSMAEEVLDNQTQPSAGNADTAVVKFDGLWRVQIDAEGQYLDGIKNRIVVRYGEHGVVCYCFNEDKAHLIAAAPDLLAVLKAIFTDPHPDVRLQPDHIFAARAALSKAEPAT